MKPVMRRIYRSVLIPALVGGGVSAISCTAILCFWDMRATNVLQKAETVQRDAEHSLRKVQHYHPPPVPVSPPLVRAEPPAQIASPVSATSSSPANMPAVAPLVDLPSFASLVRQVIPAVVNISTSRRSGRAASFETGGPDDQATAPGGNNVPEGGDAPSGTHATSQAGRTTPQKSGHAGSVSRHAKPSRHRHRSRRGNATLRRVVRPVDDDNSGAGSGFIVDPSGLIVTNRHVVGGASRVVVSLSDGRSLPARILGDDPMTDIAVIKVQTDTPLPCVRWGDSRQVEIGDWILVAGNPFGFGSSVTAGIVSAIGRDLGIGALDDFMQIDAPINPGNSGGPAFNLHGQVVAVNAAIASPSDGSVGIGFGIPAEIVAPVVTEIEKSGHVEHGWLGVSFDDTSSSLVVEDVDRNGAAWKGGLRRGDVILAVGGGPVHDARTVLRSVAIAHPGTVFEFSIRRHDQPQTLSITLGKRPAMTEE